MKRVKDNLSRYQRLRSGFVGVFVVMVERPAEHISEWTKHFVTRPIRGAIADEQLAVARLKVMAGWRTDKCKFCIEKDRLCYPHWDIIDGVVYDNEELRMQGYKDLVRQDTFDEAHDPYSLSQEQDWDKRWAEHQKQAVTNVFGDLTQTQ